MLFFCIFRNDFIFLQVTVELMIPENYNTRQLPTLPFFGEVLDKNFYFGANIDNIRGHVIEVDITRILTGKKVACWSVTFVLLKVCTPNISFFVNLKIVKVLV